VFSYLLALYIKSRQERTKRKIVNPHIGLFVRQSLLSYLMSLHAGFTNPRTVWNFTYVDKPSDLCAFSPSTNKTLRNACGNIKRGKTVNHIQK